jgi:hypothetical protein
MKKCPECGAAMDAEYQFCPDDGSSLVEASSSPQTSPAHKPAVVLYCPACASEYPLTFTHCPVHLTDLTVRPVAMILDRPKPAPEEETHRPSPKEPDRVPDSVFVAQSSSNPPAAETSKPRIIKRREALYLSSTPGRVVPQESDESVWNIDPSPPAAADALDDSYLRADERYRRVAFAIAAGLVLLAVLGAYSLIYHLTRRHLTRRPVPPVEAVNVDSGQPVLTVPTPAAAREYVAVSAEPPVDDKTRDPARQPSAAEAGTPAAQNLREISAARQTRTPAPPVLPPSPRQAYQGDRVAPPLDTHPPSGLPGLVAARLLSVRPVRTAGGYRYDLTFHLADQAGHATQWERLAVTTRSANGTTRQEQIPFYHRLGADGTMTFTVSVEMHGRAPSDWQGRVTCTSIGSDSTGRSYRASFGANVSPY